MKLLWLAAIAVIAWKVYTGRWPWEARTSGRSTADQARTLLGLSARADRAQIVAAHRARIAQVHPDRGGSSAAVHATDAARDLLLAEITLRESGTQSR